MTDSTLFGQPGTAGTADSFTGANTNAVKFSVSSAGKLDSIWVSSPSGCTATPDTVGLFDVDHSTKVFEDDAPTWSGAAGSGWIRYDLPSPVALTAGVNYKAAAGRVQSTGNKNYAITSGAVGAVTNGALASPANPFYWVESGTFQEPTNAYGNFSVWIDVGVSFGVTMSASLFMKKASFSGFVGETSSGSMTASMKKMRVAAVSTETSGATATVRMKKMGFSAASFESSVVVANIRLKKMRFSATGAGVSQATATVGMKKMGFSATVTETLSYVGIVTMKKMRFSASSGETTGIVATVRMKKMRFHGTQSHAGQDSAFFMFSQI